MGAGVNFKTILFCDLFENVAVLNCVFIFLLNNLILCLGIKSRLDLYRSITFFFLEYRPGAIRSVPERFLFVSIFL